MSQPALSDAKKKTPSLPATLRLLTVAGSDPGGGAGIQADLKTFSAFGVFGMSVVTSVTVQNTKGVSSFHDLPPDIVEKQFEAVASDIGVDAMKTGMLASAPIIEVVAAQIQRHRVQKLVVDPVMHAKNDFSLLPSDAQKALVQKILPLATLLTPNIPEAENLAGQAIRNIQDMERAAKRILDLGPEAVLIKGGHASGDLAIDLFFSGEAFHLIEAPRLKTKNTHGTGCTLSAAIATHLAHGKTPLHAIQEAKTYIQGAIEHGLPLGQGHGPLNHFWAI